MDYILQPYPEGRERKAGKGERGKKITTTTTTKDFLIARGELVEGHLPIMDWIQLLAAREIHFVFFPCLSIISLVHIFACMRFMFKGY